MKWLPKEKYFDLKQIFETNSLREFIQISLKNLYVDIGA